MSDTALSMKPPQVTDELYARIPALLKQGTTKAEIAAMFGVKLSTLVVLCSRRGISLRKNGQHKLVLPLSDDVLKSLRDAARRLGQGQRGMAGKRVAAEDRQRRSVHGGAG